MDRTLVIEYLALHAQSSTCEKRLKEIRAVLLPQLRDGEESPADLPYLLARRVQERSVKDYLTPFSNLLKSMRWGQAAIDKRVAVMEANFESIDVEQMIVEQNKAYAAELGEPTE